MIVKNRTENPLLNRVEIEFEWRHAGSSTPTKREMLAAVKGLEPGSDPDLIVVKDVNTRFGQPLTTGLALVYSDAESMKVEPVHINRRHEELRSSSPAPAAADISEGEE